MIRLALVVVVALFACSKPAPVAPAPKPENQAVVYAHLLTKEAVCVPLGTGMTTSTVLLSDPPQVGPQLKTPDAAVCDFGRVLAYCHVGNGAPGCDAFADLRPKEAPKAEAPKAEEPKPEPPKPEPKKK